MSLQPKIKPAVVSDLSTEIPIDLQNASTGKGCPAGGAHYRICKWELDEQAGHSHEFQTCRKCGDRILAPCFRCASAANVEKPKNKKPEKKQVYAPIFTGEA